MSLNQLIMSAEEEEATLELVFEALESVIEYKLANNY